MMNDSIEVEVPLKSIGITIVLCMLIFLSLPFLMKMVDNNQTENISCTIENFNVNVQRGGFDSEYVFTCKEHVGKSFVFINPKLVIEKNKKYVLRVDKIKIEQVMEMSYA